MPAHLLAWLSLGVALVVIAPALAADPLPAPREVPPVVTLTPPPVVLMTPPPVAAFYRTNPYDVWQNYDVSRQGRWVPRVVASPNGNYYYYDGRPDLTGLVYPQYWKPTMMGTPYRSAD